MPKTKRIFGSLGLIIGLAALFSACFYLIAETPAEGFWEDLGYGGVFLISFLGASSVVIPIPYTVILLSMAPAFSPIPFAVSAGIGSALGEGIGYGLGYLGRGVLKKKEKLKLDAMLSIFRRWGLFAIFLFAFTPLPDDLLFVPLGLMRYSFWKAISACALGKFSMALVLAYSGQIAGNVFSTHWLMAFLTAVILALIVFLTLRIDWVKLARKHAKRS